ncbi:bifunctional salicylyl-CoA 5-hydroxylase/oxidoreductase [Thermus sp.]|uniref:bifunctional salicylyl-CoA 5-hydroxylase/oxidoreductase n=1 Tax=Thermus sp. TaxID=275 RepID=UPI0025D2FE16|nr:bifunctional salicylyl-CoA 5-hydroxylase/oxidoreductase [Thermus sp.]MCS6867752.1 bifunctional salicylyl-CoA 5-hydroxylase/oxidoreductase [Thermus sp.]MDW8357917.1 bifunctional salicylyl-CoA 5-hydroxylase/oxidoreductase [Thermus sp.]
MRILTIGGGPAGLYFALLAKKLRPQAEVFLYERNSPEDTFGWGIVLSDATLGQLKAADGPTHAAITGAFHHWEEIEVHFKGRVIRSGGHGFAGLARVRLLGILRDRAEQLGVRLHFRHEVKDLPQLVQDLEVDLIVAADGVNSLVRTGYPELFQSEVTPGRNRYVWLGTTRAFPAFTFAFQETEWGWFIMHAYPHAPTASTVVIETSEETWRRAGLDVLEDEAEILRFCEGVFASQLQGHPLLSNARHLRGSAKWLRFPWVVCRRWVGAIPLGKRRVPVALLGDAAHTVHFSVGSGTKLAMEDAIALVRALARRGWPRGPEIQASLESFERERQLEVLRLRNAARNSASWFENVEVYTGLEPEQFAYSLLTRSLRLFHSELQRRDPDYVDGFNRWFAKRCGLGDRPVPPMFTPFTVRGVRLKNRVVVSPMAMYSAVDGTPGDFHLVHLGARALGGAALVMTEMVAPSPEGRISPGCAGLYRPEHVAAWKRIVEFVHRFSDAKIGLQLGHSGPKGSTRVGWEGYHKPLAEGNWTVIGPSPIPWSPENQVPKEMTREDMEKVIADFARAARWAAECGFDWLELHCAHGYLLSAFISPLTNRRRDAYGGSLRGRMRFPLEVFEAVRAEWPEDRPIAVRISAHDWAEGGNTLEDALEVARMFKGAGCDVIDVSSGQVTPKSRPQYGRLYQVPFADQIRNRVGIPTIAVGSIYEADHVNTIIAGGRADLCAIARPHLANPHWTLYEAARLGYREVEWPKPYLDGKEQLERLMERARAAQEGEKGIIEELEALVSRAAQEREPLSG